MSEPRTLSDILAQWLVLTATVHNYLKDVENFEAGLVDEYAVRQLRESLRSLIEKEKDSD